MADFANLRIGNTVFGLPTGGLSFQNHTVDANTEGVSWVMQAREADAITHVGFRYGARTGTPPTYIIGIESPSVTTGHPDGVVLGGGTPASATFTPPASTAWDGLWQWIALDNAYTPVRGQRLAITIRHSSGTIDASNYSTFTTHLNSVAGESRTSHPYALRNTAGTWALQTSSPIYGIRTASTRHGSIIESSYITASASTVGHRRALEFIVPSGSCTSFTVRGFRFCGNIANAVGKNPVMGLWSAAGVLQNITLDTDAAAIPANLYDQQEYLFDETTLSTLTPGTVYYIGFEVADATNGQVNLVGIGVNSADDLLAHAGGTAWRLATYDGSSWTSVATVRPFAELILGDVTGGGGSGGGYPILMAGGIVR